MALLLWLPPHFVLLPLLPWHMQPPRTQAAPNPLCRLLCLPPSMSCAALCTAQSGGAGNQLHQWLPCALSQSAVPGRRASSGHGQSLVGHRSLCTVVSGTFRSCSCCHGPCTMSGAAARLRRRWRQHCTCPRELALGWAQCRAWAMAPLPSSECGLCAMARRQTAATSPLCIQTTVWGLLTKGCARLCFGSGCAALQQRVLESERSCLDWLFGFLPPKSHCAQTPRWCLAFQRSQVVSHMITFRLSWGQHVYHGSLFLLQHIAHYTKYIFTSYIQQFYFLLSFIQQNKSATTL